MSAVSVNFIPSSWDHHWATDNFSLCDVSLISLGCAVNFSYYINLIQSEGVKCLSISLSFLRGNIISHLQRLTSAVHLLTFFLFSI